MERILGVDLGERRWGVAISDELCLFSSPLPTIEADDDEDFLNRLADVLEQHEVFEMVVGLPLSLDGGEGPRCARSREIIAKMRARFEHLKVVEWDERFSTLKAESFLRESGMSRKKQKGRVDAMAARIILQSYLNSRAQIKTDLDEFDF